MQQRFGGVQFNLQAADIGDHVGVVTSTLDLGVDPRASLMPHEIQRVAQRAVGYTQIDGGLIN